MQLMLCIIDGKCISLDGFAIGQTLVSLDALFSSSEQCKIATLVAFSTLTFIMHVMQEDHGVQVQALQVVDRSICMLLKVSKSEQL